MPSSAPSLPRLESQLRSHGFDGEEENLRCLIRIDRGKASAYRTALRSLAAARRRAPSEAAALMAKLLNNLDRPAEAESILKPHLSRTGRYPVKIWLAESLILQGRAAEALTVLTTAPPHPWLHFFSAAAHLALGRTELAKDGARRFRAVHPGAAAHALDAILLAAGRDWAGARRFLAEAAAAAPRRIWPLQLQAVVCSAAGDPVAAMESLKSALRTRPSAALFAELAKVQERLGLIPFALASATAAAKLRPDAETLALKAELHHSWREYDAAARCYSRAAKAEPADPKWHFHRSRSLMAGGRFSEAAESIEIAAALGLENNNFRLRRVQLQALCGRRDRARELARGLPETWSRFALGYLRLCQRRYRDAARSFEQSAQAADETALRLKSRFYRTVALVLQDRPPETTPGLSLAGLGVDPPYSATAEAVRLLRGSDVVFNNVTGDEMAELLGALCQDYRPVAYHGNGDESSIAKTIMRDLAPGKKVAFVTRGNALVHGPLAWEMVRRCNEDRKPWYCLPAVSSSEFLHARFGHLGGGNAGTLACDSQGIAAGSLRESALAMTLYHGAAPPKARFREICDELKRCYGESHPCCLLDHKVGQEPLRCELKDLEATWGRMASSALVFIPAKPSAGAGALVAPVRAANGPGRLLLLGTGVDGEPHCTLEGLMALGDCDRLYIHGLDSKSARALSTYLKPAAVTRNAGPGSKNQALSDLRGGSVVGWVTPRHPLLWNGEARILRDACQAMGLETKSFGAIAPSGVALCGPAAGLGIELWAIQEVSAEGLLSGCRINADWPLTVPLARRLAPELRRRLARALSELRPSGRFLFRLSGAREWREADSDAILKHREGTLLYLPSRRA